MEIVAGEHGLELQQLCVTNPNFLKISFFNARGLKLGHFAIFNMFFEFMAFFNP